MEVYDEYQQRYLRPDKQLLVITHLTQLLNFITGFGGLLVPLILWAINKDKIVDMNQQGKEIINFQLSMLLYGLVSIPLIFLLGLGIVTLVLIGLLTLVFPILNAIRASNGEKMYYPLTIKFL